MKAFGFSPPADDLKGFLEWLDSEGHSYEVRPRSYSTRLLRDDGSEFWAISPFLIMLSEEVASIALDERPELAALYKGVEPPQGEA